MKDKASMLGPMFPLQLQEAMLQLEALKCTDLAALRQDWATRAKEELEKKGKVERRRQRSARLQGNEVADPNDSQAYTVYPIEPEVMVRRLWAASFPVIVSNLYNTFTPCRMRSRYSTGT